MKKLLFIFLLLMTGQLSTWAQKQTKGKVDVGDTLYNESLFRLQMLFASRKVDSNLHLASAPVTSADLMVSIDRSPKWHWEQNTITNQPLTNYVFPEGSKTINVYLAVPKDSLLFYRYNIYDNSGHSIITDGKFRLGEGVPIATDLKSHRGGGITIVVDENHPGGSGNVQIIQKRLLLKLGTFNITSKVLTIEFYNNTNRNRTAKTIIYNKPIAPPQLFFTNLQESEKEGGLLIGNEKRPDGFAFKLHDSTDVDGVLLFMVPTNLTFFYHVYLKNLNTGKSVHVGNNWNYNDDSKYPRLMIDASYLQQPGRYEVSIKTELHRDGHLIKSFPANAVTTRFTVLEPEKTYTRTQLLYWLRLGILMVVAIAATFIVLQKRRHARRINQEKTYKLQAQMQLNAVRAQLNPHFIFNALAGIQNLMNRQETDQANRYLARFARLTRSVLDSQDFITMADELALLTDYLEMEKLRFGFTYRTNTDPALDAANVEIPAMLLQPIIENAVKHGVSGLGSDGMIALDMQKQDDNILISVADNGQGFDSTRPTEGLGLKLTRDRIKLLNELHPDTPISLEIATPVQGAHITVTLNHWL